MVKRLITAAACLAVGATLVLGQVVPAGTGLIAYWTLNDTTNPVAVESSGSAPQNDGTYLTGAALPTTSASVPLIPMVGGLPHPPGNTASRVFTQATANQRVEVPDSAELDLTGSFTLAAWVNPTGVQTNQLGIIEHWSGLDMGPAINGYFLRLNPSLFPKFDTGNGTTQSEVQAPGALTAGVWSHVAATFEAGMLRIHVNGGAPTTAAGVAPTAGAAPLHIGVDYGANRFNGNIDDVRIYNRRLTDTEILVLATGLTAPTLAAPVPGPGTMDLSWGAVTNATSYRILQGSSGTGPWTQVGTTTGTTFTVTNIFPPTQYWYQVVAVYVIESQPSNIQGPVVPLPDIPRTNDHDEGVHNQKCACGSTIATSSPLLGLLALAALPLLRRRRSPLP